MSSLACMLQYIFLFLDVVCLELPMTLYSIYVNTQNTDNASELNNSYLERKEPA